MYFFLFFLINSTNQCLRLGWQTLKMLFFVHLSKRDLKILEQTTNVSLIYSSSKKAAFRKPPNLTIPHVRGYPIVFFLYISPMNCQKTLLIPHISSILNQISMYFASYFMIIISILTFLALGQFILQYSRSNENPSESVTLYLNIVRSL